MKLNEIFTDDDKREKKKKEKKFAKDVNGKLKGVDKMEDSASYDLKNDK